MKHYQKRTIALVLASVITVVGAFGAENYKNSLMSLEFNSDETGAVHMTLLTKKNYESSITPVKKDDTTYVLMLPETNSEMTSEPEISGSIESVNIRTMPYTNTGKGYTKITIKTYPNTLLTAKKAIYLPDNAAKTNAPSEPEKTSEPIKTNKPVTEPPKDIPIYTPEQTYQVESNTADIESVKRQFETTKPQVEENYGTSSQDTEQNVDSASIPVNTNPNPEENPTEAMLLLMGALLIIVVSIFIYIKGKNKLAEILGEQGEFDLSDDNATKKKKNEKNKNTKNIKSTINTLDKMYSKPFAAPKIAEIPSENAVAIDNQKTETAESNIVDLDELFQAQNKQTSEQNDSEESDLLTEFLNDFSSEEEEKQREKELEEEHERENEQIFKDILNNNNIKFSAQDIARINNLMNSEISDETIKNISKLASTNPIKPVKRSKQEILEELLTSYTINQNISFTKDDVDALKKLISVELDSSFVTDLRTNPERLKEMQKELDAKSSKPHKIKELLTLNVKDMLPDLSEALKKQGGREIQTEKHSEVVYYSEGYDVNILKVNENLPDLTKALKNNSNNKYRPSDEIVYSVDGYNVQTLAISDALPDMKDVKAHPNKYNQKKNKIKADESALLRNIADVKFKPFYDGSENFEIVNDFSDTNVPTVHDVQKEFGQFKGFEIIEEEDKELVVNNEEKADDDFEVLYNNDYYDLDKEINTEESNKIAESVEEKTLEPAEETIIKPVEKKITEPVEEPMKETAIKPAVEKITEPKKEIIAKPIEKKSVENAPQKPVRVMPPARQIKHNAHSEEEADKLMKMLEKQQQERKNRIENKTRNNIPNKSETLSTPKTCIVGDTEYEIISSFNFKNNMGCYLAKSDNGYSVLGFNKDSVFKLKNYEKLDSNNLQSRVTEKLPDGTLRYIIKIGLNKFILNVSEDNMEYIMDLC